MTTSEPKAEELADPEVVAPNRRLLPIFGVLSVAMTFPYPSRLATFVPGDYGDAMYTLWALRWIAHAAPEGFGALWDTNMFHPHANTLAWSDPMLGLAPVQWVLTQMTGSIALAMNLLHLLAWTLSLWFTYRLAFHFTARHAPSIVAALAFTFSAPRVSHAVHGQLANTAWLVPLIVLLAARFCRQRRPFDGLLLGIALAGLTVTSSYYGVMMSLATAILMAGYAVAARPRPFRRYLAGLALGGVAALLGVAPVALHYLEQREGPNADRGPDPALAAHLNDFLAPVGEAYLLPDVPPFETRAFNRGVENRLFPGVVALGLGLVGTVVVLASSRRSSRSRTHEEGPGRTVLDRGDRPLLLVMMGTSVVMLVLSFGLSREFFGRQRALPYAYLEQVIPGLDSIRATARLALVAQCILAVVAAIGLSYLLRRSRPRAALLASVALGVMVLAESAAPVQVVRLPNEPDSLAVNQELATRPSGVVVELPMGTPADGTLWGFIEAPRMFLATWDWQERLNGYSGFFPQGFDQLAGVLESFPDPVSMDLLDEQGVDYVVLRTEPVGDFQPPLRRAIAEEGRASYSAETVEAMLAELPAERVESVQRYGSAYLVELVRPCCRPR